MDKNENQAPVPPWMAGAAQAAPATQNQAPEGDSGTGEPDAKHEVLTQETTPAATPVVTASVEPVKPSPDEVTVTVPKAFKLRISAELLVEYRAGVQQMPRVHAEHWYSKANGVSIYDPSAGL